MRLWWPRLRKLVFVGGTLGGLALLAMVALWWRLSSGPIELDIATPWLTAAIKDNFGGGHEVEIGGTQLERDANGRTALRIRDIVVRDAEGTIVASAPKAEVGVSGTGLFTGRIRAERLSLVGAEMAVRIEPDSKVTVFAGSNKRPFVTASAASTPVIAGTTLSLANVERAAAMPMVAPAPAIAPAARRRRVRGGVPDFAALLAWIESLDASGSGWPRPDGDRPQRRQPHRRRSAQRQAVDVHQYRSERDAAQRRRPCRHARLGEASSGLGRCARP